MTQKLDTSAPAVGRRVIDRYENEQFGRVDLALNTIGVPTRIGSKGLMLAERAEWLASAILYKVGLGEEVYDGVWVYTTFVLSQDIPTFAQVCALFDQQESEFDQQEQFSVESIGRLGRGLPSLGDDLGFADAT